jgi:hypothetical protein
MVAIVKSLFPKQRPESEHQPVRGSLAKLKVLHAEAEETARLANLLGRSGALGAALPFLAIVTIALSVDVNPAPQIVWLVLVGAVSLAVLIAYRHAMKRPFEHDALKDYAKDLSAILLFAGFAWGSGAFLALPSGLSTGAAIAFALLPAASIAYLLRDRIALFLFLAPVAALSAAACLLKPFDGGWIAAGAIVLAGAALVGATRVYERLTGIQSRPAMLSLP